MKDLAISGERQIVLGLGEIEKESGPYCMSFSFKTDKLEQSLKMVGLVNPLIVVKSVRGPFHIVSGFRRLHALMNIGIDRIRCRDLSGCNLSPFDLLSIALYENIGTRNFNDVEKGMVLNSLSKFMTKREVIEKYMPLFDLKPRDNIFMDYKEMNSKLSEEAKTALACGIISMQTVRIVRGMDEKSREQVFQLIINLKFNINQQKELIDILKDLINIKKSSVPEILKMCELDHIFENTLINNPQKCKRILKALREIRFPNFMASKDAFKKRVSRLGLPSGVRIEAPPYFEAPHYRMEVLFKDGHSLQEKIALLSEMEELKSLGDPWEDTV